MMQIRHASVAACVAGAILAQSVLAQPAAEAKLDQLLAHVAPEAQVIVAIPSLKRLNDDITELLGGMDRADMIAAGRPIDLAKSMLGLGGGVDDRRGAAIVLVPGEDAMPTPIALIPVVDPAAFLETNFKLDEATGSYTGTNGAVMFIRELDDHFMLLGDNKDAVERYQAGGGAAKILNERFGSAAEAFLNRGELLVLMDQSGARLLITQFGMPGAMMGAGFPDDPDVAARIAEQREAIVSQVTGLGYVLDVDPMGLTIHGLATFVEESDLAKVLKAPAAAPANWSALLPGKPYYFAAGIDLKAVGALDAVEALAPMFQVDLAGVRDVLGHAEQIAFIASPSPAGLSGGILNDSAIVIRTTDVPAMHKAVRDAMERMTALANERLLAVKPEDTAASIQLNWTESKEVGDDKLIADAYEVRAPAGGDMMLAIVRSAIFGQSQRGFIADAEHAVIITFSQRPAVLASAIHAANGHAESLADDEVLASVRRWIGTPAPVELYIGVGQLNKFGVTVAKSFGQMTEDMDLPELDPDGPPVAVQFSVGARSMTSTLAMPAPLLADVLREFERAFRPFTGADVDAQ